MRRVQDGKLHYLRGKVKKEFFCVINRDVLADLGRIPS